MSKFLIIMSLLLLSSCCGDPVESNRYMLSESEKESIPYSLNDVSRFTYTNGYEFDMEVSKYELSLEIDDFGEKHCQSSYIRYEQLYIELSGDSPELQFIMRLNPEMIGSFFSININQNSFGLDINSSPQIDTITLNGYLFCDVYEMFSNHRDTSQIIPSELLYSKTDGIIQITLSDDEKFTLKK